MSDGMAEAIPLLSRILAVVDTYDAMTHDRPYRKAMTWETAIAEIKKNADKEIDQNIVEIFVEIVDAQKRSKDYKIS